MPLPAVLHRRQVAVGGDAEVVVVEGGRVSQRGVLDSHRAPDGREEAHLLPVDLHRLPLLAGGAAGGRRQQTGNSSAAAEFEKMI